MSVLIGVLMALAVAISAAGVGMDRDRAFYPTVLIVIASYYVLFAVQAQSLHLVLLESLGMAVFSALAIAGFKIKPWLVVAGLACHAVFDFLHGLLIDNPGVPQWWPSFCAAYDLAAALGLAVLLRLRAGPERRLS